ncbi:MAG: glycosyltransferase family 4 protein [Nitrospirae bacterium]|nr:glycosyltransferase family 4 protein [Nitrospirota bacterium]MBF0539971.1 glycosyltransferase family 4 protein [Nitrospirota bacterium]
MKAKMVIFHNFYSPYRNKFFNLLSERYDLTVIYLQSQDAEGRIWSNKDDVHYKTVHIKPQYIGSLALNNLILNSQLTNPDIIVLIDNMPNLVMMFLYGLIYFKGSKKVLWTEDWAMGYGEPLTKTIYRNIFRRLILPKIDELWCFGEKVEIYWRSNFNLAGKNVKLLKCSPYVKEDFEVFIKKKTKKNTPPVFGYIGYFNKRKGIMELINAFKSINSGNQKLTLKIAGGGESQTDVINALDDNIAMVGYVEGSEKEAFFDSIDFAIIPSLKDPWGLVTNEITRYGIIPIISDEAGSKEMAEGIGYIYTAGSQRSLINAINWAVSLDQDEFLYRSNLCQIKSREYVLDDNIF